jgi:hypothetical protein
MCHNYAKHFLLSLSLFSGFSSFAQNSNKENSPYSRFGLGEQRNGLNVVLRGMGSISSAYSNGYNVNTDNPASYAGLKLVTYEAAGEGDTRTIITGNQSYGTGAATLSYFDIGIPIGNHAGIALGLKPNTRVYYAMQDTVLLDGVGPTNKIYSGDGSTNYAFIGGAYEFKGLSIGANIGYLFGTIRNSTVLQKQYDTVNAYNSDFSKFTRVGGIYYKLGLQYSNAVTEKVTMRLGGTVTLSQDLNGTLDNYGVIWRSASGSAIYDTAINATSVKGKVKLPLMYSFGIQFLSTDKWLLGADFSASQWSQFRNFGLTDSVDNSYRFGVGGEFTPNNTAFSNYLQRVTYRLGFYYGKDYVTLRSTDINYYAATVGASLPFRRSPDRIHLALELGRRGTEANGLIKENFLKFSIGLSLNDKWFIKRRYD